MLITPERLAFLNSLAPPDPEWQGTGAVPLRPDVRDRSMHLIPAVGEMLRAGFPASADLSSSVRRVYDQGASPACVAFSSCACKDLEDSIDRGGGPEYAGHQLYIENGGDGTNGVDSRAVLRDMQSNGTPLAAGGRGNKIASYAFAPQVPGQFRDTLKAAIAARKPCVIAMLLPSNFGWSSSGSISSGYHQQTLVGYDDTWAIILNNWGANWGNRGFDRVPWDFIEQNGMQSGYAFAYTVEDAGAAPTPTPNPQPNPNPQPQPQPNPNPQPQPNPQPNPNPNPSPNPQPGGLIMGVSAPHQYHGGLVFTSLHMSTGQFVPSGTVVSVTATTPSGLTANGRVTL